MRLGSPRTPGAPAERADPVMQPADYAFRGEW